MAKIKSLKLNKLQKEKLESREMSRILGTGVCACGCMCGVMNIIDENGTHFSAGYNLKWDDLTPIIKIVWGLIEYFIMWFIWFED